MPFVMDIDKVLGNLRLSRVLLGVDKDEFMALLPQFENVIKKLRESRPRLRASGGGSKGNIKEARRKLFFILFYLKTYPTFDVAAFVFGSSRTRTCVWAHEILPLLEKTLKRKVVLPKRQVRTPEEFFASFPGVREVLIDGVERPCIRSKKDKVQNKHYSGKKKRHMRKNIVVTNEKKSILVLTPSKHGKVHDKRLEGKTLLDVRLPEEVTAIVDTGFQGFQRLHANTLIPKKKPPGGFLTDAEKSMNRLISSVRINVEHAIGGMKRFSAVSHIYRNKNGFDDQLVRAAAGLWNLHVRMN